ncbi:hypothetical protein DFP72DRAFT_900151 [Ephemerocybe angulata]|uniref:Uncharacterized protein n=1 Tax=Ephemerocybe angulata TaxID=980116 RepID=A0A8H6HY55_9AGAR|nr:hypothetical protein DFP72DRAFT_900151 [Tulosesus angulatus]
MLCRVFIVPTAIAISCLRSVSWLVSCLLSIAVWLLAPYIHVFIPPSLPLSLSSNTLPPLSFFLSLSFSVCLSLSLSLSLFFLLSIFLFPSLLLSPSSHV